MQTVPFGNLGFCVSRLGFGMMRLPTLKGEDGQNAIDREKAIAMLRHAIDGGVNYVDTAYGYHGGESEVVTGLALRDGYRERVKLATKLPQWLVSERGDMDRLLDEQLKRLGLGQVDFYLLHALDRQAFRKMKALGYKDFFNRARKDGRIRYTGFSFHDDRDAFLEIIEDDDWDLAQIQLNYLDDESQATLEGMRRAGERGIPVVCMEPLRGGALAEPPESIAKQISSHSRGWSAVEWAFRYTGDFPEVVTILSGMSTMDQVHDNLRIFREVRPRSLTEDDRDFTAQLKRAYQERMQVACTQCGYCQPCPEGVRIPRIFELYNQAHMFKRPQALENGYADLVKEGADASLCVRCGACEEACPQKLPIMDLLEKVHREARADAAWEAR